MSRLPRAVVRGGESVVTRKPLFSSDSKWLFVCCGNVVQVYSQKSRELVHVLSHHTSTVTGVQRSPDNFFQLFTVSLDGHVVLWDYTDATILKDIDFGVPIYNFALRPGNHSRKLCLVLNKDEEGDVKERVVKCVDWVMLTSRSSQTQSSEHVRDAHVLLHIAANAGIVLSAEGDYLVSYNKTQLLVYDFAADEVYNYRHNLSFTCLASHPVKQCIATGDQRGLIILWYDIFSANSKPITTKLHWHSHAVTSLCFTNAGIFLLSGGEESVLVLWQLDKNLKQFRPRVGASTIEQISCSPDGRHIAVSLQSNIIQILSGMDSSVDYTIGGLRTAKLQLNEDGVKTGLVVEPYTQCVVMNSHPGHLQFYSPEQNKLWMEHDVTEFNYVSRTFGKALVLTTVDHVSFSPDGSWMATVESREDTETSLDLKLKFWKFIKEELRYELNTCVDPPHYGLVMKLLFQPSKTDKHVSAVSVGNDGKIKTWKLQENNNGHSSWVLRSISYHQNEPASNAAFSEDGSLLAVVHPSCVTLWDSNTCELKTTFLPPYKTEVCRHVTFGHRSSAKYLVGGTDHYLTVWDLLTCSVYIFNPSSYIPLEVHSRLVEGRINGAVFRTRKADSVDGTLPSWLKQSELFFLDSKQILYSLGGGESREEAHIKQSMEIDQHPSAFEQIFGLNYAKPAVSRTKPSLTSQNHPVASTNKVLNQLLTTPAHVMPPLTSLCSEYLMSLLPPALSTDTHTDRSPTASRVISDDDKEVDGDSDSKSVMKESKDNVKMDTSREEQRTPLNNDTLDWLRDCFKDLLATNSS
ncbi:WD repeat-containing protein 75-like isoform X2 [Dysidea avara]|uniref:WD repeat-containing protein 75-like isoform X2 n=1 Tax=Dysidea avara TaxID=196820 RepID=UPI00332A85CA